MKRLLIAMMALAVLAGAVPAVHGQLVSVHKIYRVNRVDVPKHRVEVHYLNDQTVTLFVNVNSKTQVLNRQHHAMSWRQLRKGDVIRVKGGLEAGGQISGKTIVLQ